MSSPAKVSLDSDRLGSAPSPVPLRETVWAPDDALSVTVKVPVRERMAVGVNVTVTAQLVPALSEPAQVLVSEKSPPTVMPLSVRVAVPVFVTVTVWAALAEPRFSSPKLKLLADSFTPGAVPVPLRLTV